MHSIKRSTLVSISVVLLALVGGFAWYANKAEAPKTDTTQSQKRAPETPATDPTTSTEESKPTASYMNLEQYTQEAAAHDGRRVVYFFHAPWCPICKQIDADLTAQPALIPTDVTIVKVDFDSQTALRQKYGVTTQYTFVQIDTTGNEVSQWSATSAEKALAGVKPKV